MIGVATLAAEGGGLETLLRLLKPLLLIPLLLVVLPVAALSGLCFFIMVVFSCSAARRIFSSRVRVEDGFVGDTEGELDLEGEAGVKGMG